MNDRPAPIAGRDLNHQLVLLYRSGCHTGPDGEPSELGHRYRPHLDDRLPDEVVLRLRDIQPAWMPTPLLRQRWAFSPDCADCRKAAKQYLTAVGLTPEHWLRLGAVLGFPAAPPKLREESDRIASQYGWHRDGRYGRIQPDTVSTAQADDPAAIRHLPRVNREDLDAWKRSR